MAQAYHPPGVIVSEVTSTNIAPIFASPQLVGIVGAASGYEVATERLVLTGTTAVTLGHTGVSTGSVVVKSATTGATYTVTTDYIVTQSSDPDATVDGDEIYTIERASGSTMPTGGTFLVTYHFTDTLYGKATTFSDLGDVSDKYGNPFDANGLVSSPLSYAARLAFLNGASEVILVAAAADTNNDIEDALAVLEGEEDIRIVVAARGASGVAALVQAHVDQMNAAGRYRIGVVGVDGSTTLATAGSQRTAAQALNDEAVRMLNVSSLRVQNSVTLKNMNIGGHFAAAALAGMYAARDVQVTLTRKNMAGVLGINDVRTETDKTLDSAAGLLVLEEKGGIVRVRHDITTKVSNVNSRESSVVRAKYEMAARLKGTLDNGLVGITVPATQAPTIVEAAVTGVLEGLVSEQAITGYSDIAARLLTDPTTVEVRFTYVPAYPINNIQIIFTIDTTTGDFALAA